MLERGLAIRQIRRIAASWLNMIDSLGINYEHAGTGQAKPSWVGFWALAPTNQSFSFTSLALDVNRGKRGEGCEHPR